MIARADLRQLRESIANLPDPTSYGRCPDETTVYLPASHVKAIHPDATLVTGMRGAGKTFWWSALQVAAVRTRIASAHKWSGINERTEASPGFGVRPNPEAYPGQGVLPQLLAEGVSPRMIWRTVVLWRLCREGQRLRSLATWRERVDHVASHPDEMDRMLSRRDAELHEKGASLLILFDALDRCGETRDATLRVIRGLLETGLDLRPYRRLRLKVFLRLDQAAEPGISDFPDASKILASRVELAWPRHELYGLLWRLLRHGEHGDRSRRLLEILESPTDSRSGFLPMSRSREDRYRKRFHGLAGPWMGTDRRRGFPYTWIPNHLGDTFGRVSPRSFLTALKEAARDTADRYSEHDYALHYRSIKAGVRKASETRVHELREDDPWLDTALRPLRGMIVPVDFREIENAWKARGVIDELARKPEGASSGLPPRGIRYGALGLREDLQEAGIFYLLRDGRVNIPDVFRIGYGLGRKGGVRPAR